MRSSRLSSVCCTALAFRLAASMLATCKTMTRSIGSDADQFARECDTRQLSIPCKGSHQVICESPNRISVQSVGNGRCSLNIRHRTAAGVQEQHPMIVPCARPHQASSTRLQPAKRNERRHRQRLTGMEYSMPCGSAACVAAAVLLLLPCSGTTSMPHSLVSCTANGSASVLEAVGCCAASATRAWACDLACQVQGAWLSGSRAYISHGPPGLDGHQQIGSLFHVPARATKVWLEAQDMPRMQIGHSTNREVVSLR